MFDVRAAVTSFRHDANSPPLAAPRSIIEAHGGRLWATAKEYLTLPIKEERLA